MAQEFGSWEILRPVEASRSLYVARLGELLAALRVLPPGPTERRRFLERLKELSHQNLVGILDFEVRDDGSGYVAQELLEGESLRARMQRGALHAHDLARIGAQAARGASALHSVGLVQGRLNPANIFIAGGEDGVVKLLESWRNAGEENVIEPATDIADLSRSLREATGYLKDRITPDLRGYLDQMTAADPQARPTSMRLVAEKLSALAEHEEEAQRKHYLRGVTGSFYSEPTPHLNVWLEGDRRSVPIQQAVQLQVNIGPRRGDGVSNSIPPSAWRQLQGEGSVEIVVVCPDAAVEPSRGWLPLPPDPARIASFTLTPLVAGSIRVSVVLLIDCEPIHRIAFQFEALDAARPEGVA